jgi:hypothetical protein
MRRIVLSPSRFVHAEFFRPARRSARHPGASPRRLLLMAAIVAACAGSAQAAGGAGSTSTTGQPSAASGAAAKTAGPRLDNSGNHRQELRACREGRTAENLSTCLREAHAAEAERKRGRLTNTGDFEQNALARCQAFKRQDDQTACRARIVGQVEIRGSVAGGGILREAAIHVSAPGAAPTAQQPGGGAMGEMGAGMPPPTPPPSDDIGKDGDDLLPEEQDSEPYLDESERLEEQTPMPEPAR